jgi:hypothetical protein
VKGTLIFVLFSLALASFSCQSPATQSGLRDPQFQVNGAYSDQLSTQDIAEIVDAALKHPKMLKPIHRITTEAPDRVEVSGGGFFHDTWTVVKVRKQNGHWMLIKGSFYYPRIITTS